MRLLMSELAALFWLAKALMGGALPMVLAAVLAAGAKESIDFEKGRPVTPCDLGTTGGCTAISVPEAMATARDDIA
jgi:hypothetical protein